MAMIMEELPLSYGFKDELVFIDDYLPSDLHEEEVSTLGNVETSETQCLDGDAKKDSGPKKTVRSPQAIDQIKIPQDEDQIRIPQEKYQTRNPQEKYIKNSQEKDQIETPQEKYQVSVPHDKDPIKIHECDECFRMFSTRNKLLTHYCVNQKNTRTRADGRRLWVCMQCEKTFFSRKGWTIHRRSHTGERPYACRTCGKSFLDSSTLIKHQLIHRAVRPFACRSCGHGFNQKVALQRHEKTHRQPQQSYACRLCPKTFVVKCSLQAHEKLHSNVRPFLCKHCSATFHTLTALRQHKRVHVSCLPCKDNVSAHAPQSHSTPITLTCPCCPLQFKMRIALRRHLRLHVASINVLACGVCKVDFDSKQAMIEHLEKQHVNECMEESRVRRTRVKRRNALCSGGEVLESDIEVKQQQEDEIQENVNNRRGEWRNKKRKKMEECVGESENNNESASCDVEEDEYVNSNASGGGWRRKKRKKMEECVGERENNNGSVESHCKAGDLSSLEALCDVAVSAARELGSSSSMASLSLGASSSGEKASPKKQAKLNGIGFFCKSCKRMYSSTTDFRKHRCGATTSVRVRKCAGGGKGTSIASRTFDCDACGKSFRSRNGCLIHERSHTGERPYPCRWCEKAFGDTGTRHKHERIHTGERPFKCAKCPRAFNQRAALRAHQATHTLAHNDPRAHTCQLCPSSFTYFANLRRHVVTCHVDRAAYTCPVCQRMLYHDLHGLYEHVETVHVTDTPPSGDKVNFCPLCPALGEFVSASSLCDHIVNHASDNDAHVITNSDKVTLNGFKIK